MDIMGGLAAISQVQQITKELRNIDSELQAAELKLRLADLVDNLLEAKDALIDAKARERELVEEIQRLKAELQTKQNLHDEQGLLFEVDQEGNQIGEPYCNHCWVKEEKLYRLIFRPANEYGPAEHHCQNCNAYLPTH